MELYGQRGLSETVFSVIKRTLGNAVRAQAIIESSVKSS